MIQGRLLASLLALVALHCPSPADADQLQLQADWLELRPGGGQAGELRAHGKVRLRYDGCELEASEFSLIGGSIIVARQAWLRTGSLELRTPRLRWQAKGALEASWPRLWLCSCGSDRGLALSAEQAAVAPSGERVHLRWPALWVGSRRVLALPYLALPLRRGVSGLLLPQIGWSGRDGVRFEQAGYLAGDRGDLLLGAGYIQERGAWGRLRGSLLWDGHGELELAARGLVDRDRGRGALQGSAWLAGGGAAIGLTADLTSDAAWPAELERDADRVFAPYLRSRGWASAVAGPLTFSGSIDVYQDLGTPVRQADAFRLGWGNLAAGLLPLRLLGPVWLEAQLQFQGHPVEGDPLATPTPLKASLEFFPRLVWAAAPGILRLSGQLGYRGLTGWADLEPGGTPLDQHGFLGALELSLPLARSFDGAQGLRHRLEPFAAALYTRSEGSLELPGVIRQQGAFVAAGLRSSLLGRSSAGLISQLARAELRLELPLDEPPQALRGSPLLHGELQFRLLSATSLSGLWRGRPGDGETVELRGQACTAGQRGRWRACAGYLRLRQLRAEDLLSGESLGWPLLDPLTRLALQTALDQVFASAELRAGPATGWARVAVDPLTPRLTQGSYGLRFEMRCRCVRLELLGISRSGQRWPDAMVQLSLAPSGSLAGGGCGGRSELEPLSPL